jgi:D-cysteine desulfhydrase
MTLPLHDREPPRVPLANQPTRGHWLRYGAELGARIWLKRDDHTGSELMGNKVRKLEYLMAEAVSEQATHVITCGGEQSNHARATAFAAAQLGMKSVLILRTDDPAAPPPRRRGARVDLAAGMARSQSTPRRARGADPRRRWSPVHRAGGRLERARELGLHPRDARARG